MNTEQKHTPGPWEWATDGESNNGHGRLVVLGTREIVMNANEYATDCMPFIDASHANARLIAAAPDLLEACQKAIENAVADCFDDWFVEMRAAIAKATA